MRQINAIAYEESPDECGVTYASNRSANRSADPDSPCSKSYRSQDGRGFLLSECVGAHVGHPHAAARVKLLVASFRQPLAEYLRRPNAPS